MVVSVTVLEYLYLLALEALDGFLIVIFKLNLNLACKRLGFDNHALAVCSLNDRADGGGISDSLLVGLVLLSEAAEESAARTGYL